MAGFLLGYDVGSSSIKASLLDIDSGREVVSATSPGRELSIETPYPGWAEQDPEVWWRHVALATAAIGRHSAVDLRAVEAIGVAYQMHGLVTLDASLQVLRPAIIWCDSRAVEIGERAFRALGPSQCLGRLLNSPGNFTASKLRWVLENEPDVFERVSRAMLPGDYIAFRLTGELRTTVSGLSEAVLWDFSSDELAGFVLDHYELSDELLPPAGPSFGAQGGVTSEVAEALGLRAGVPVTYRAGDQPNNALALNVLEPGQVATTAGTSGVVYGVTDRPVHDERSRVNTFVHVNHRREEPRYGVLLCVNGTASLYRWLQQNVMSIGAGAMPYEAMNDEAARAPVGAEGLSVLPFGNGAERTLENRHPGATIEGLDFNVHRRPHLLRAAQEGIVFALEYGLSIMRAMGVRVETVRAGRANLFLSPLFAQTFATVTGARVELMRTDGAQGAARGAGIGAGIYSLSEAFDGLEGGQVIEPETALQSEYRGLYERWCERLARTLSGTR